MTTKQLTVSGPTGPLLEEVVSSLPVSFAHASGDADVAFVDGSSGWPERVRAAISSGVRGVVVAEPGYESPDVLELARESAVPVILSEGWAGNPTVLGVAARWGSSIAAGTTVESSVVVTPGTDQREALLRQLRTLSRMGVTGVQLTAGCVSSASYSVTGRTATGAQVILFGVNSLGGDETLGVVLTTALDSVHIQIESPRSARPGAARLLTVEGGEVFATVYETAHRGAFRRMHATLAAHGTSAELVDFASDARMADAALLC